MPLAHFIPPPSPLQSADEVVGMFHDHLIGIRLASIFFMFAVAFYFLYSAAISAVIKRIEGPIPPLAYAQLIGGMVALLPFLTSALLWTCAAYRPERVPAIIQMLNDLAWIFLVMPAATGVVQPAITAFAILADKRDVPILPRWVGFFNIWVTIAFLPGVLVGMFKTGPFAWNGLLAFWIVAVVFLIYVTVMTIVMLKENRERPAG